MLKLVKFDLSHINFFYSWNKSNKFAKILNYISLNVLEYYSYLN